MPGSSSTTKMEAGRSGSVRGRSGRDLASDGFIAAMVHRSDDGWKKTAKESLKRLNGWVNLTHIFATMRQIDAPVKPCRGTGEDLMLVKFGVFAPLELLAPELL